MKFVAYLTVAFLLCISTISQAQQDIDDPTPELRTQTEKFIYPKEKSVSYEAATDFSASTLLRNDSLTDADRTNFVEWAPKLLVHLPNEITGHLTVPFFWLTDQSNKQIRFIGRPEFGVWYLSGSTSKDFSFDYGLSLRLPLADTSFGQAEFARVWGIYPGYTANWKFSESRFRVFQTGGVAYNTGPEQSIQSTDSEGNLTSWNSKSDSPLVALLGAGAGLDFSEASIDLSLNFANGIGNGHFHRVYTSTNTGQTTTYQTDEDLNPLDVSFVKLAAHFFLTKETKLSSYIIKSLKNIANHGVSGLALDDIQSYASIGIGVGIAQRF